MAQKPTSPSTDRITNRKHVSRAERDALFRQRVVLATAAVLGLVLLILAVGGIYSAFIAPGQPVAEVNGEQITRRDYFRRVNYERFKVYKTIEQTKDQVEEFMTDPQSASFILQLYEQQFNQLANIYQGLPYQTLQSMIEEKLIEEEAENRGITVSDEEVDEEIRRQIARQEGAQIEVDVTATAEAAIAATATAELFTPTPTLEPTATEVLTESESITTTEELTPTATPAATFTPAPTVTPNILSQDTFSEAYAAYLSELQRRTSFTEADYRSAIRLQLLREKLREAFASEVEVEPTSEQVRVAHILVATEAEAQDVVARLQAGEEFADVAQEVSTDSASATNGGELDWFGRDQMLAPFEEAAFALTEEGELSEPVETTAGWHIIQLLEGPEQREKPETQLEQERNQAFDDFLQNAMASESVRQLWEIGDVPDDPFIDEISEPLPTPPPVPTSPVILETPESTGTDEGDLEESAPEAGATPTASSDQ